MSEADYNAWTIAQEGNFRWYTERMFKDQINTWFSLLDFFQTELDQQEKVVVEIGCGPTGGLLKFMKARLLIGIEPLANRFLEKGFENIANSDILFLNSFGEHIPLVNDFADVVCCIHSLGHVQRPQQILLEVDRILKEGGRVFILEIMRKSEEVTRDHPVALQNEDLIGWFEEYNYCTVRSDTTKTIQENDQEFPLFYSIFRKEKRRCTLSAVIDFDVGSYEDQIGGGWYDLAAESRSFRWVSDQFLAYLAISKEHKTLVTEGYVVVDHFPNRELCLSFYINETKIGEHIFRDTGLFCLKMPLRQQFPEGKVKVKGWSSHFFVPDHVSGNGDDRELSFMIFRIGLYTTFELV